MSTPKLIGLSLLALSVTSICNAAVITVGPGGKYDYQTIQEAVDASSNGDEIIVAPGQYIPPTSSGHTDNPVVDMQGKTVWLHSSDGPETTFIDGLSSSRCIVCWSGESLETHIEGFTIRNGLAQSSGGAGLFISYSNPTISNCVFENNEAGGSGYFGSYSYSGGAIYNEWGGPSIIECVFRDNQASGNGGAIMNANYSYPSIEDCVFETNNSEKGGAICNLNSSSCNLSGCTFLQNNATFYGGAVYLLDDCELWVSGSTFESNYSDLGGGGVYSQGGTLTVISCSFDQNVSLPGNGGGIDLLGTSSASINNSEFTSNSAINGGGVFVSSSSWLQMGTSMFCENSGGDVIGNWSDLGGNEFNSSCDGTDGACCTNDICVVIDAETCDFVGGEHQGLNTTCSEELCPSSCLGDVTGDGQVNTSDLLLIISVWGSCP